MRPHQLQFCGCHGMSSMSIRVAGFLISRLVEAGHLCPEWPPHP